MNKRIMKLFATFSHVEHTKSKEDNGDIFECFIDGKSVAEYHIHNWFFIAQWNNKKYAKHIEDLREVLLYLSKGEKK